MNGEFFGILRTKRLLKEKGIKNYLDLIFETEEEQYTVVNEYLDLKYVIKDAKDVRIMEAKRNFFTL
ncbi:MAG TPA: hypothetical protein VK061_09925 [Bacillota bacterium]|nr:hypothetical protein [Bacillota bacterium]